jgi:hypothetical protein
MTQTISEKIPALPERLVVAYKTAAKALDVCPDTIAAVVDRGELERVVLTKKKFGVTWRSVLRKAGIEAAS